MIFPEEEFEDAKCGVSSGHLSVCAAWYSLGNW